MTYSEIAKASFDGSICPEEAKANAMREYERDCALAARDWSSWWERMSDAGEVLLRRAQEVVDECHYHPCMKAGFFAALFSQNTDSIVSGITHTSCAFNSFDCRIGPRTCTRIETGIGGDRYDNCPSIHAAQWLEVPPDCRPSQLLWMEAGAVFNGKCYELANGPSDNPFDRVYRCSMCLKTMLGKGVVDICNVGLDKHGNVSLTIAPIAATLNTLVIMNCADMLAEKAKYSVDSI